MIWSFYKTCTSLGGKTPGFYRSLYNAKMVGCNFIGNHVL